MKEKNSDWFRAQVLEVVVNSKFTHIRFNSNSLIAYLFMRHEFGRYKFWQLRQCAFFEHLKFSFPTFVNRNFEAITNKRRQISNRLYCYFSWNSITERIWTKNHETATTQQSKKKCWYSIQYFVVARIYFCWFCSEKFPLLPSLNASTGFLTASKFHFYFFSLKNRMSWQTHSEFGEIIAQFPN